MSALQPRQAAIDNELVVITGPPGAGKSTIARLVAAEFERSVLVEGDVFFGFVSTGAIAPWLVEAREQNNVVIGAAAAATGRFAAAYPTVYDGVLGPWYIERFLAESSRSALHYAVVLPSADECVRRVRARERHLFNDEKATRAMHHEFELWRDRYQRFVIDVDDGETVAHTTERIFGRLQDGVILFEGRP
jgi:cytidylate kinase